MIYVNKSHVYLKQTNKYFEDEDIFKVEIWGSSKSVHDFYKYWNDMMVKDNFDLDSKSLV